MQSHFLLINDLKSWLVSASHGQVFFCFPHLFEAVRCEREREREGMKISIHLLSAPTAGLIN